MSIDCKEFLANSLIIAGEIGGNDYYYMLRNGTSIEVVKSYVPIVVETISSAIEVKKKHFNINIFSFGVLINSFNYIMNVQELIELGAKTLIVPGNMPMGCTASFLTIFQNSNKEEEYDSSGCLKWINELYESHNQVLQNELNRLRNIHSHTKIIYADYYNSLYTIYRHPHNFGTYLLSKFGLTECYL